MGDVHVWFYIYVYIPKGIMCGCIDFHLAVFTAV